MAILLLLLSLSLTAAPDARPQAPATPAPRPAQPAPRPAQPTPTPAPAPAPTPAPGAAGAPRPAQTAPRPRAQQPAGARSGMAITVTSPGGATIAGVQVTVLGATERSAETNAAGQVNFPGLQGGTYRLRFSGDAVMTFEREVVLKAGQIADVDVTLNAAPPKPAPVTVAAAPPPAPAAAPPAGPKGEPLAVSVPDLLEKNYVGTQPRRETLLSCSGSTRTTMIQLNMPMPDRLYDTADAAYYVIGGEGSVRLGTRMVTLGTNGYVSVPRGTAHAFVRTGRRPLILLAVLSGEPCEEAK